MHETLPRQTTSPPDDLRAYAAARMPLARWLVVERAIGWTPRWALALYDEGGEVGVVLRFTARGATLAEICQDAAAVRALFAALAVEAPGDHRVAEALVLEYVTIAMAVYGVYTYEELIVAVD